MHLISRLFRYAFLLPLAVLLASCFHEDEEAGERLRVGDPLPPFSVECTDPLDGEVHTFVSTRPGARGSVIVFFTTWCADCQRELPILDSLYRHGRFEGQNLVCIGREEAPEVVEAFWRENRLAMPYSPQRDRAVFDLFAERGVPRVYIADTKGVITSVLRDANPLISHP